MESTHKKPVPFIEQAHVCKPQSIPMLMSHLS